jgi:CBS-domain-containing membrane protein
MTDTSVSIGRRAPVEEKRTDVEARHGPATPTACERVEQVADWLEEAIAEIDDRIVSCAEAQMAELLRYVAEYFERGAGTREECAALMRQAVIDLNHGWDLDVDDTGNSLLEVALLLLGMLEDDRLGEAEGVGARLVDALRGAADGIGAARLRDLVSQIGLKGPVVVLRPGIGAVELSAADAS